MDYVYVRHDNRVSVNPDRSNCFKEKMNMGDLFYEVTSQNWTIGIYKTIEEAIANIEYLGKQKPDRKFAITEVRKEKLCTVTAKEAADLTASHEE